MIIYYVADLRKLINASLSKSTNISGNEFLFGSSFVLAVDKQALVFAESLGLLFLFIMLFSVAKLERRNGYVRYFVLVGFLRGFSYLFSFSGGLFHNFFDPSISSLAKIGISF